MRFTFTFFFLSLFFFWKTYLSYLCMLTKLSATKLAKIIVSQTTLPSRGIWKSEKCAPFNQERYLKYEIQQVSLTFNCVSQKERKKISDASCSPTMSVQWILEKWSGKSVGLSRYKVLWGKVNLKPLGFLVLPGKNFHPSVFWSFLVKSGYISWNSETGFNLKRKGILCFILYYLHWKCVYQCDRFLFSLFVKHIYRK